MKSFTSLDLQKHTGDVQRAASVEPVVITNHGRPRLVISTIEEYSRLKQGCGETVALETPRARHAVTLRGLPEDPLGYDTTDLLACARMMAEAAISGRNRAYVDAEIAAVEKRLSASK